jgi:GNAT superfamily N-acetyltransferase
LGGSETSGQADCVIRGGTPADTDALFELAQLLATSFRPRREAFERCFREIEADPSAWIAVAEQGGAVIGYCLGFDHFAFYANGRVAWVEEIVVRPGWRRNGLGARLMMAFEAWALSRGASLVALATRRAAPFYTALGYEESATYFRKRL